jgi:hypothetical protein
MPSGATARRKLPFIKPTDAPKISELSELLANALDNDVEGGQGTLAERPAAKLRGRIWMVQGDATEANNGNIWWDTGAIWVQLNTVQQGAGSQSFLSWGQVFATGEVAAGSGDFTVAKVAGPAGRYEVKWTKEKTLATYAVVASAQPTGGGERAYASITGQEKKGFTVEIYDPGGKVGVNGGWNFTVIAAS